MWIILLLLFFAIIGDDVETEEYASDSEEYAVETDDEYSYDDAYDSEDEYYEEDSEEDETDRRKKKEDYRRESSDDSDEDDDDSNYESKASFGEVIYVSDDTFQTEVLDYDGFVLVDFYATWCGPCMSMAPSIEEIAEEHPEYKIVEVDVDECYNLSYQYDVESIPTLMYFNNGELMERTVGSREKSEILNTIKKYY